MENHLEERLLGHLRAQMCHTPHLEGIRVAYHKGLPGGGGGFRGGNFPQGKFRISTWCGIFPSFFEGRYGIFPMRNCACGSHRRTCLGFFLGMIMLNKGATACRCLISSKAQACGCALQILWH